MKELLGHNIILYPDASNAVLRNKTLKVYVRESQIPDMESKVGLGVVLILQMCWSTDPSMSLNDQDEGQEQGPWAGHRFDITWDDQVDESWTDVSEDVFERLHTVLASEFDD
ncbi:hypothetical protein GGF43_004674 [Coemansia sp. RSA 2618]|nr:hypothetical protein GGF43_004674 [Coemansia sp. RSA 2618]